MRLATLLSILLLCACGSPDPLPPDGGDPLVSCVAGRACPRSCTQASQCEGREVCADGVCGQPAPTSTQYSVCQLDADCPSGDSCSLGACAHDCLSDRDCTGGTVCTSRGRCVAVEAVSSPAPVETLTSARLSVSATALDFGHAGDSQPLELKNTGGEPLRFRALSDKPWLSATPAAGTLDSGGTQVLTLRVDRALAGSDNEAFLRINSTGGFAVVRVYITRNLTGLYVGEVQFNQPAEVALSALRLNLSQPAEGNGLTGVVIPEGSLLFPSRSPITGELAGDAISLTFELAGATGSAVNPHFPRALRRTVRLTGRVTGTGTLVGTVSDTLEGPLEARALQVKGTFRLQRAGPALEVTPVAPPAVTLSPLANPFTGAAYNTCRTNCPTANGCGTPLEAAQAYLRTGANFYASFQAATAKAVNPFDVVESNCEGSGCINTVALRCAQYHYSQALLDAGTKSAAQVGLLDSLEVMADYALLFGHAKMVQGIDSWRTVNSTPANELDAFVSARSIFTAGSHGASLAEPLAMLDPFFLKLVDEQVDAADLRDESNASQLEALVGDYRAGRQPREYLRRQALVVGGALRAALEQAEHLHRAGRLEEAKTALARAGVQGYVDLAILGALLERTFEGATPAPGALPDLQAARETFVQLSRKYDALLAGRNPAGYPADYVPFMADTGAAENNYRAVIAYAEGRPLAQAVGDQQLAEQEERQFEVNLDVLGNQLQQQLEVYHDRLLRLCGSTNLADCGTARGIEGSQFALAVQESEAAARRVDVAVKRYEDVLEQIKIEETRATAVTDIATNSANLILADGQRMKVLAYQEQNFRRSALAAQAIGGIIGGVTSAFWQSGNPSALISAIGSTAAGVIQLEGEYEINKKRQAILVAQQARVEFDRASVENANSAAVIATKNLEAGTLSIEVDVARKSAEQSASVLVGIYREASFVAGQLARLTHASQQNVRRLMEFRLYADSLSLRALESQRVLRQWAYLATRAMEYEVNASYTKLGNLWKARTAGEIQSYLNQLDMDYEGTRPLAVQRFSEVLSVRDHLLDLGTPQVDGVTGTVYSPQERFRRFVADPANRDLHGNLKLSFVTFRPDKPMFTRSVCNDRIESVRLNLVGSNLGSGVTHAFVRLTHGGTNYLRACGDNHDYVPYNLSGLDSTSGMDNLPRVATVQAGINAPNARDLQENTDFARRSVLAGPWELVIDQRPSEGDVNPRLNLEGLDDIELVIDHRASTIQ